MNKRSRKGTNNTIAEEGGEGEESRNSTPEEEEEEVPKKQKGEDTSPVEEEMTSEQLLKSMQLKVIIKENHGKEISVVALNQMDTRFDNLVVTVGDTQVNVYDNRHFGNNLDLMMHFINKPLSDKEKNTGYALRTCCWMKPAGTKDELQDDSYIAIAGEDRRIHIISIKRTQVFIILEGHTDVITDLAAHADKPHLLASASKDGTVRLWDIHTKQFSSWDIPSSVVAFSPNAASLLCGGVSGTITELDITKPSRIASEVIKFQDKKQHTTSIDCIRFLGDKVVSKSVDGRILIWDRSGKVHTEIKVPSSSRSHPTKFDINKEGEFLCVGNSEGTVTIYKLATGKPISKLEHKRSRHPVRSCAFSSDTRNILYVTQDTHLWRFDYSQPQPPTTEKASS